MWVLYLIVFLGILVVVHEWGHFIVARLCGIRVDEFSIGMGPLALRIGKLGDTEYNIRWIPIGGYVKIAGMEPDEEPLLRARDKVKEIASRESKAEESVLPNLPLIAENTPNLNETAEQRKRDERDGFYAHPLWQRSLVIFAGPFMSFVLGYVIFFGLMLFIGQPGPMLNRVDTVNPGSEAQRMGLRHGDTIVAIDKTPISNGSQMVGIIHSSANKPLHLKVVRDHTTLVLTGTPKPTKLPDGSTLAILGFQAAATTERTTFAGALTASNELTKMWLENVASIFRRHDITELRKNMGGPIFMAQMTQEAVNAGGPSPALLLAQLSMSLALFNLLPIPILDGGHLLMFLIEALRRGRRLTQEQQYNFLLAGLAIIGVLFVLVMFNDILRKIHPIGQ